MKSVQKCSLLSRATHTNILKRIIVFVSYHIFTPVGWVLCAYIYICTNAVKTLIAHAHNKSRRRASVTGSVLGGKGEDYYILCII